MRRSTYGTRHNVGYIGRFEQTDISIDNEAIHASDSSGVKVDIPFAEHLGSGVLLAVDNFDVATAYRDVGIGILHVVDVNKAINGNEVAVGSK